VFLMLFKLPIKSLPNIIHDFSRLSYGIYLCHIVFLTWFYETLISDTLLPTACKILTIAVLTIVSSYLLIKALSYLPKSKWVVGN
jgi:surface polysaccharide O-acyltransferase-like enzyme